MENQGLTRRILTTMLVASVLAPVQGQWEVDFAGKDFFHLQAGMEHRFDSLAAAGDSSALNEGGPYSQFRRWSEFWSLRLKQGSTFRDYFEAEAASRLGMHGRSAGNTDPWHEIGPKDRPSLGETSIGQGTQPGIGPIHFISFSDADANKMLCGSTKGGVWYSENAGVNWTNGGSDGGAWKRRGCRYAVFKVGDASTWYAANSGFFGYSGAILRGTNYGSNWEVIADQSDFPAGGIWTMVNKIATDPSNPDVLYVASLHRLWKSVNVNTPDPTWTEVYIPVPSLISDHAVYGNGAYSFSDVRDIYDLEVDPINSDNIYAAVCYEGEVPSNPTQRVKFWCLMRSQDGGDTWSEMPNQPVHTILPQVTTEWIDGAQQQVTTDWNANRMTIEMTKSHPEWLYVFYDLNGATLYVDELYKIDDASIGTWLPPLKTNIQLLYGSGNGFGVDQVNGEDVYIDHNWSTGRYLTYVNHVWTVYETSTGNKLQYHVDAEDFVGDPNLEGVVWMANHGGIHRSLDGGATWEWRGSGLAVADVYRMATSYSEPDRVLMGLYHDASILTQGSYGPYWNPEWRQLGGGDGQKPFIDSDEGNWVYWSSQGSSWNKSDDYGENSASFTAWPCNGWETTGAMDHGAPNAIYLAGWPHPTPPLTCSAVNYPMEIKRSLDRGTSWEVISDFRSLLNDPGTMGVWRVFSSPYNANDLLVYFHSGQRVFRTGMARGNANAVINSWKEIYVPRTDRFIADIDFDPEDPDVLYFGYTSEAIDDPVPNGSGMLFKVRYDDPLDPMNATEVDLSVSVNGSAALLNTGVGSEAVALERGSNGGIYVATDLGVFYTNNELLADDAGWQLLGENLPHVTCRGLEINYKVNKLRGGMEGRGIWEHDLWCPNLPTATETGSYAADIYVEVLNDITSTAIVPTTRRVNYRAGNEIALQPGFHAQAGSAFHAFIHPCDRGGNSFKSLVVEGPDQEWGETVDRPKTNGGLIVQPNPTSRTFSIVIPEGHTEVAEVLLFNTQGIQVPVSVDFGRAPLAISFSSNTPGGVYAVRVLFNDGSIEFTKIILQR